MLLMKSVRKPTTRMRFFHIAGLVLFAGAPSAPAQQPAAADAARFCSTALSPAASLGHWDLHLGPERTATTSLALPGNRDILLEAHEIGDDVDVEVAAGGTAMAPAGNPVRHRGVVRVLLRTDQSGRATVRIHAIIDGGPGRQVTLRAFDAQAPQTDTCRAVSRALATGDAAFAQAQQVSAGQGTANSGSRADYYAGARREYLRAFETLAAQNLASRAQVAHMLATLSCKNLEDWHECERWAAQAAQLFQRAGDAQGAADAESFQALARMELAQLPEVDTAADLVRHDSGAMVHQTLEQLRRLAAFYAKRGELFDAAEQLNLTGLILYNAGDYSAALRAYGRAEAFYERVGDRYHLALVLQNIALVDCDLGRASTALSTFRRAQSLVTAAESPRLYGWILDNYGLANRLAGHLDSALALHTQALELTTRTQDSSERGRSLFGIGMVYSAAGDRELAASFLHQALDTFTRGGEGRDSVSVLRALAMIAAQDGHHEEAVRLDREALARATGPIVRAHLLAQIADSESLLGRNQAAEEDLALAARIPAAGDLVSGALVQFEQGVLDYRTGQMGSARARLQAALTTDLAFGLDAAAFDADVTLARVDAATGHTEAALRDLDAGLELSEVLRVQASDPELRATSMQPLRPAFDLKVELLAAAYQRAVSGRDAKGTEQTARAALAVTERSRARAMQDIAVADYTHGSDGRVGLLLSQKSQLLRDLAAHEDRLEAGGAPSATDTRVATLRTDIAHLREQLAVLDSQLAVLGQSSADASQGRAGAVAAPPPDVALIAYWLGASEAYAWLQTQSQVRLIDLGSANTLRAAADAAHAAYASLVGTSMEERLHASARLSRLVLLPVLAQVPAGITRLVIVPDGPLHYVSFAALPTRADAEDSFLIRKYEVAYGSSIATVLATNEHRTPTQGMLLVADAVYGAQDSRLGRAGTPRASRAADPPLLRSGLNTAALERLPATAAEASDIAQIAAPLTVDHLEGFGATRDAVLALPLERYRYIHFAVHATTDAEIPQLSSLVLSAYDAGGRRVMDRIWAGDLMGRRFNARTVVLSACDTALGRDIGGEGLFSLRYVVLARGAQSVVASLWDVPDRSTATLMQAFYKGLLQENRRPESALTLAMRQMLQQGPRDPVFWAPFTATIASLQQPDPMDLKWAAVSDHQ
jgi:CHAT domain-containing protein